MDDHPEERERGADENLSLVPGGPHVEHDVADEVIVEREGRLVGQLRDESDQVPDDLEHVVLVLSGQLLHEELEEEVAVLCEEGPDDLVSHLVDADPIRIDGVILQELDDLGEAGADGGGKEGLGSGGDGGHWPRQPLHRLALAVLVLLLLQHGAGQARLLGGEDLDWQRGDPQVLSLLPLLVLLSVENTPH